MPQLPIKLSEVDVSDAETIGRYIQVPAMKNGPLYRTMFPQSDEITEDQKEEIIHWYINMLEDAFQDGKESFLKSSIDGVPVGFCGWTIIEQNRNVRAVGNQDRADKPSKQKNSEWLPKAIDVDNWFALSKDLRDERNRILKDLDNICRKSITILTYIE